MVVQNLNNFELAQFFYQQKHFSLLIIMNFKQAIENLFSFGDNAEAVVLGSLLFISFLLGLLLWWLLAHWPQRRRLKKELALSQNQLEKLEKEQQSLQEQFTILNAKAQRLEEETAKKDILLSEKDTKIQQIQQLYTHLEAERDKNYQQAEAAKLELGELKTLIKTAQTEAVEAEERAAKAIQERDLALAKAEEIKGLLEELETERSEATQVSEEHRTELSKTQQDLQKALLKVETLEKDLKLAADQLMIQEATDGKEELLRENSRLNADIFKLQAEINHLEQEREQLLSGVANNDFAEIENIEEEEDGIDALHLEQMLEQARQALENEGFFTQINETEIIQDPKMIEEGILLFEQAQNQQSRSLGNIEEKPQVVLSSDEEQAMSRALQEAEAAMNWAVFFNPMDESILLATAEDPEEQQELDESELKLLQMETSEYSLMSRDTQMPAEIILDPTLLESINSTIDTPTPVLYQPEELLGEILPPTEKPILDKEEEKEENTDEEEGIPPHITAIEAAIIAEIGHSIPKSAGNSSDDLKRINGIGVSTEEKLKNLGICTYEQISCLTEPVLVGRINTALGLPPGSIENDQWVNQAKQLLTKQKINDLTKDINLSRLFKR